MLLTLVTLQALYLPTFLFIILIQSNWLHIRFLTLFCLGHWLYYLFISFSASLFFTADPQSCTFSVGMSVFDGDECISCWKMCTQHLETNAYKCLIRKERLPAHPQSAWGKLQININLRLSCFFHVCEFCIPYTIFICDLSDVSIKLPRRILKRERT